MQVYSENKDILMVRYDGIQIFMVNRIADVDIKELTKIGSVILVDNVPAIIEF